MKLLKITDAKVLSILRQGQFTPAEKVYVEEEPILTIPAGSWELEEKTITPATGAPFKMLVANFAVGKEKFDRVFRSGSKPTGDEDIKISTYKAEREFHCTNGTVIAKGTVKQFADLA